MGFGAGGGIGSGGESLDPAGGGPAPSREDRLAAAVAELTRQLESGTPVDREALVARHPDLASDLLEFLEAHSELEGLVAPLLGRGLGAVGGPPWVAGNEAAGNNVAGDDVAGDEAPDGGAAPWTFGEYEVHEEIGRGGMGVVYRATQRSLGRPVALKMILAGRFASARDVERFRVEAEAVGKLDHPGIVSVHEVGEVDGQHYFSMQLVEWREPLGAHRRVRGGTPEGRGPRRGGRPSRPVRPRPPGRPPGPEARQHHPRPRGEASRHGLRPRAPPRGRRPRHHPVGDARGHAGLRRAGGARGEGRQDLALGRRLRTGRRPVQPPRRPGPLPGRDALRDPPPGPGGRAGPPEGPRIRTSTPTLRTSASAASRRTPGGATRAQGPWPTTCAATWTAAPSRRGPWGPWRGPSSGRGGSRSRRPSSGRASSARRSSSASGSATTCGSGPPSRRPGPARSSPAATSTSPR